MNPPPSNLRPGVFSFLVTFLILAGITACSDDDPGRPTAATGIQGVVRNANGDPAEAAMVYLGRDPDFPPPVATFVVDSIPTDPLGRYEFAGLEAGSYRVYAGVWKASGEGFARVSPFQGPWSISDKSAAHVVNHTLQETMREGLVVGDVYSFDAQRLVPADSATVSLFRYEGAETVLAAQVESNGNGRYVFPDVETGNFAVTAIKIMESEAPFPVYLAAESQAYFCDGVGSWQMPPLVLADAMVEKPAVYLYPEQPTRFQVRLELGPGVRLTASEPDYDAAGAGWDVIAEESGRIDQAWDYLFYEIAMPGVPLILEGWCLSWSELASGLESLTLSLGLNAAERDDFLGYWLGRLPRREYYEIRLVYGNDLDLWVKLDVTPVPASSLRFWLFFRGCNAATDLTPPPLQTFERSGTTLVEWGGAITP
jgi:hypothetical protein